MITREELKSASIEPGAVSVAQALVLVMLM